MKNYIVVSLKGNTHVEIDKKTVENLKLYKPRGCPIENYSMFDLLKDWINMYSWQVEQRNKQIPLIDFIKNLRGDGKVLVYGQAMVDLLT